MMDATEARRLAFENSYPAGVFTNRALKLIRDAALDGKYTLTVAGTPLQVLGANREAVKQALIALGYSITEEATQVIVSWA